MTDEREVKTLNAIFVGPKKTGTTWIYKFLQTHKSVSVSERQKELEYFNKNYTKGEEWYRNNFDLSREVICDVSPSYFHSDIARYRLKKDLPDCKIIVTIRNPVDRTISHFKHNLRHGIISEKDFQKCLGLYPDLISHSMYAKHLQSWIDEFGEQNILILPLELLSTNPPMYINKLCTFLGISDKEIGIELTSQKVNKSGQPKSYFVAKILSKVRRIFNTWDLHVVIKLAKKLGLKEFFYSGGEKIDINDRVKNELSNIFEKDILGLKDVIDNPEVYEKFYVDVY